MSDPKSLCGPHTEIVKTEGVRITRCPCGAMHVSLSKNGTTVQLSPDYFAEVVQAFGLARTVLAAQSSAQEHSSASNAGRFVTITMGDPKKPSN